jgi:hypothetical protein
MGKPYVHRVRRYDPTECGWKRGTGQRRPRIGGQGLGNGYTARSFYPIGRIRWKANVAYGTYAEALAVGEKTLYPTGILMEVEFTLFGRLIRPNTE